MEEESFKILYKRKMTGCVTVTVPNKTNVALKKKQKKINKGTEDEDDLGLRHSSSNGYKAPMTLKTKDKAESTIEQSSRFHRPVPTDGTGRTLAVVQFDYTSHYP